MSAHELRPRRSLPGPPIPAPSPGTPSWCDLDIETSPLGTVAVLRLAGEIDMFTLPLIRDALSAARDHRPDHLVVDLSEITFCSIRGFVELAGDAFATTGGYTLTGIGPHMERLAALARWDPP